MSDNLQSNVLTVAADGTIGAQFTGSLQLNEDTNPYSAANAVQWVDASGAVRSWIQGLNAAATGAIHELHLLGDQKVVARTNAALYPEISPAVLLVDQNQASSFLQLVSPQQLQVDGGSVANGVVWPGASAFSNALVINHGLGRIPKTIELTPARSTGGAWWFPVATARSAASVTVVGCDPFGSPGAGDTATIDWTVKG